MRLSRSAVVVAYAFMVALSLFLKTGFPKTAIAKSFFDDNLYIRLAYFLRDMQWLGPYDKLTIAKGPFYSIFIALSNVLHIPLYMSEQILYVIVSFFVSRYLSRATSSTVFGLCCFAILSLNPIFWNSEVTRVLRENIYISLSLAVVCMTAAVCFPSSGQAERRASRIVLGFLTGLVAACFWMTREEGIWIVPTLCFIVLIAATRSILYPGGRKATRHHFAISSETKTLALSGLTAIIGFTMLTGAVRTLNYVYYGEFETAETHSTDFNDAYGALARIHQNEWHRYVVFPKDARERAYSVSAAARELKPFLDGSNSARWARFSCVQVKEPYCSEVGAGWFMWALRDAVALSGHTRTGADAMSFYRTLAKEVNDACDANQIPCNARRSTIAPPFKATYIVDSFHAGLVLTDIVAGIGSGNIGSPGSIGDAAHLAWVQSMTGETSPLRGENPTAVALASPSRSAALSMAKYVNAAYHYGMPVMEAFALLGLLIGTVRAVRGAPISIPLIVCAASLVAVASRVGMLAYMEVSFMPTLNSLYSSSAPTFVLLFVLTGLYELAETLRGTAFDRPKMPIQRI